MSDYFPPELIQKILLELPVKSLIRFTSVCKLWRSIITSPSFISSHFDKPRNETFFFRSSECTNNNSSGHRLVKTRYSLLELANSNPSTVESFSEFEDPAFFNSPKYYTIVGSCRGIVCFAYWPDPIYLWNPRTENYVVIPKPRQRRQRKCHVVLGFGVSDHEFKVLRLVYYGHKDANDHYSLWNRPEAKVFSLRTAEICMQIKCHNLQLVMMQRHNLNEGQLVMMQRHNLQTVVKRIKGFTGSLRRILLMSSGNK